MLNLTQDIHPLTDFKRNTTDFMSKMKQSRRPLVLTVNGKAALVVQDAESYQQILERLEHFESVEAIRVDITDPVLTDSETYVQFIRDIRKEPEAAERCPLIPEQDEFPFEIRHLIYFSHRIIFGVQVDAK